MRFFSTIAALAIAASVSAQSNSTIAESSSVEASSTSTSLSPQATCLAACSASDICCQAACVNVPCPNEAQVNATTQCAGQCVQGNGTEEETAAYASCQASCVSSYFLTTTSGAPSATSVGAASTTGPDSSASSASSASRSGSSSGSHSSSTATSTSSESSSSASATSNVAPERRAAIAGAGLLGLILVGLAL